MMSPQNHTQKNNPDLVDPNIKLSPLVFPTPLPVLYSPSPVLFHLRIHVSFLPLECYIKPVLTSCWKHTDAVTPGKSFPLLCTSGRKLEKIILKLEVSSYGVLTEAALCHSQ